MRTTNPQTLWGIEMEIPGFVEEWEKAGKEGTKMKLIWNELLHANFRCGRMCGERAEEFTVHECVRRWSVEQKQTEMICPVRWNLSAYRVFLYQEIILKV